MDTKVHVICSMISLPVKFATTWPLECTFKLTCIAIVRPLRESCAEPAQYISIGSVHHNPGYS